MIVRRHLLLGSIATLAAPAVLRAEPRTVKMGALRLVHSMPPFFYEKFAPEGTKIEIVVFDSPTDGKNAVVTKSVDFGTFGVAAAILGGAAGEPVVVVGAMSNKGMGVISKAGSDVKTIKDLKGKKVGIWPGSTQEVFILERLRMEGMTIKDVTSVRVPFGEMPAMLARGDVDARRREAARERGKLDSPRRTAAAGFRRQLLRPRGNRLVELRARHHLVGDAQLVEPPHLLGDGPVQARVAAVDAGHVLARGVRVRHMSDDLVQVQGGGVDDPGAGRGTGDDRGRHQRAGVETDRACSDQVAPAQGQEIGRAGAGADEMHGHAGCSNSSLASAQVAVALAMRGRIKRPPCPTAARMRVTSLIGGTERLEAPWGRLGPIPGAGRGVVDRRAPHLLRRTVALCARETIRESTSCLPSCLNFFGSQLVVEPSPGRPV